MALTGRDRRRLLAEVRNSLADALHVAMGEHGFRLTRRDAAFRRESDGVQLALRLVISSRPESLGGFGILVEPVMSADVPA